MQRLENKIALVTGAGGGIGNAVANLFTAHGATVIALDLAFVEPMDESVECIIHDIRDERSWHEVVADIIARYGRVDILVNSAGVIRYAGITEVTDEEWDLVIGVNETGTWLGMRAVIPAMVSTGGGSIVNISSGWGLAAGANVAAYHASKGAIHGLTRTAALEFASDRVRVNTVAPGWIHSPMSHAQAADINASVIASIPLGAGGQPTDIAYGCLYLASDEAGFVTGADLVIDGGALAG